MKKLATYETAFRQIMRLIAIDTKFSSRPDFTSVLNDHPRLIVAINHSTPLSWLPSALLLALHAIARGGGERRPIGVMDHIFFQLPILKDLARYFTQTDRPQSYDELSAKIREGENIDLVLFPEGSNCFFGPPDDIQKFRSPRFVELSIETGTPILICVHRGSEQWATTVPISPELIDHVRFLPQVLTSFLETRLRKTGLFTLPLLPKPLERFEMLCELYRPSLEKDSLSEIQVDRRTQVKEESDKIRARMRFLLGELRGDSSQPEEELPRNLNNC